MEYQKVLEYLSKELEVRKSQVATSLNKTPALTYYSRKNMEKLDFCLEAVENPSKYTPCCKGKVPVKMYEMIIKTPVNSKQEAIIFSHKVKCNGLEKTMVSTASTDTSSNGCADFFSANPYGL